MIQFTDNRLFVKGTCSAICEDINTGDVLFQSNKMSSGSINATVSLTEVRFGFGNPIASFISSDAKLTVDFTAADFDLWAKAAQLGMKVTYSAPVPECEIVTAESEVLSVDITNGTPVPALGSRKARAYVQEVGELSPISKDGKAYDIDQTGTVQGFTAVMGKNYKVWYFIQKPTARKAIIESFVKPRVVKFTVQIPVFSNSGRGRGGSKAQGTRVGWLYYIVPYLNLGGDASLTADQNSSDTTKISGTALAYDPTLLSPGGNLCGETALGYMVYVPEDQYSEIQGIAVMGGVVTVEAGQSVQIPVKLVMHDGSLVNATNFSDFDYEIASGGDQYATVDSMGVVTGIDEGETECTITYVSSDLEVYECYIDINVTNNKDKSSIVGIGKVGYMLVA